jgi:hypothetical protein
MTETAAGPTGPGVVVLELGAGIGALVLYTPPGLDGEEIEISRDDEPGARSAAPSAGAARTHSRVRPRPVPGGTRYAAVYPGLPAGHYTIWRDEKTPAAAATIIGGKVSNCHWPE